LLCLFCFFFQAEDGIRDFHVTGVQTCALPICREDGGGMMIDMFCHWEYLIGDLFGKVDRVLAHATTDLPERVDESGATYPCTARSEERRVGKECRARWSL